jgi:hypothetical protein
VDGEFRGAGRRLLTVEERRQRQARIAPAARIVGRNAVIMIIMMAAGADEFAANDVMILARTLKL